MLDIYRPDGGFLCDIHEGKYKKKPVKSCIRGSIKMLLALSLLPEYWSHRRCSELVEYFRKRGGIFRSGEPGTLACKDFTRNSFPITWRATIFELLLALGRMGIGNEPAFQNAWDKMEEKRNNDEKYILDWTPTQCPWKVGRRGEPNRWVTFYCLLAKKYKDQKVLGLPAKSRKACWMCKIQI
jgi:hypothetical protein